MNEELEIRVPVSSALLRGLRLKEIVYVTGTVYTFRDRAHVRAIDFLKQGKKLPVDFRDSAIWHCGPIVRKLGDGWIVPSAGSTTSARMEKLEPMALEELGIRVVIGKGGMGRGTAEVMGKLGAVYLATVGGCGASLAKSIIEVRNVYWDDLGMPEAIWELEVRKLGPLIVGIDTKGNNLHERRLKEVQETTRKILENLDWVCGPSQANR